MGLLTEYGKCDKCEIRHGNLKMEFKCRECGEIICDRQAINGKQFNRPGQRVHCHWVTEKGKPTVTKLCGVVDQVES